MGGAVSRATEEEPELGGHPGPRQYVWVAIVLAVVTGMEVGLYYLNIVHALLVGLLLFLAAIKFTLVALWFMHLRFDNRIFQRLFATGIVLAISVYVVVLVIFRALPAPFLIAVAVFLVVLPLAWFALRRRRAVAVLGDEPVAPMVGAGGG